MFAWLFLSSVCLAGIAWQDFKSRSVYWWLFLALFVCSVGLHKSWFGELIILDHLVANSCILLAIASLAGMVYILKYGLDGIRTLRYSVGIGDMVMLPVFVYLFAPVNLILFFVFSISFALVAHTIIVAAMKREMTIPLAGYWSILLWICLIGQTLGVFNIKNDNWIYTWLTNW